MASSPAVECLQAFLRRNVLRQLAWTGPIQTALWPLCPWTKDLKVRPPHLGTAPRPEGVTCRTEAQPHRIRMRTKHFLLSGEQRLDVACMKLSLSARVGNWL